MNIVLDANIYISALISPTGNPAKVIQAWENGIIEVAVSAAILDEISRVLQYPRLQNRYQRIKENSHEFVVHLKKTAIIVEPTQILAVVQGDESDNRYVECAIEANAQYIVTGDPHLLNVQEYQGIKILTPTMFLALLQSDEL